VIPTPDPRCVGIDVSKHRFDVQADGKSFSVDSSPEAIAQFVQRLRQLEPKCIIIESTGGYEQQLIQTLLEAHLPVTLVNPRRVRHFGKIYNLAKTDAIDARLLALFGQMRQGRLGGMHAKTTSASQRAVTRTPQGGSA
jgi:transposase